MSMSWMADLLSKKSLYFVALSLVAFSPMYLLAQESPDQNQLSIDTLNLCYLEANLVLNKPTLITCDRTFHVADQVEIKTQGFALVILVMENINFNGLRITDGQLQPQRIHDVEIVAQSATGQLNIKTQGNIRLEFDSVIDYAFILEPGRGSVSTTIVSGQKL